VQVLQQRRCAFQTFSAPLIRRSAADIGLDLVQLGNALQSRKRLAAPSCPTEPKLIS